MFGTTDGTTVMCVHIQACAHQQATNLHGVHPFLVRYFLNVMLRYADLEYILNNLQGLSNVMLQQNKQSCCMDKSKHA